MISYNYLFKIFIKIFIILYELSFTIIEKTAKIDQTELFDSLVNISNIGIKSILLLFYLDVIVIGSIKWESIDLAITTIPRIAIEPD